MKILDDLSLRCLVARMAADGSWGYESLRTTPLPAAARERLVSSILDGLDDA